MALNLCLALSRTDVFRSTHRERKEYYTKGLEYQISSLKEVAAKALSDNRRLKQILAANNISYYVTAVPDTNQTRVLGSFNSGSDPSLNNGYTDPSQYPNNSISSQSKMMSASPAATVGSMNYDLSSVNAGQTPGYSPSETSTVGFAAPAITPNNGYVNGVFGVPRGAGDAASGSSSEDALHPFFKNPNDPLFISFVVE